MSFIALTTLLMATVAAQAGILHLNAASRHYGKRFVSGAVRINQSRYASEITF